MTQYALYQKNYDYLDTNSSPNHKRSGGRRLIKIYENEKLAKKALLEHERTQAEIEFNERTEWYELDNESKKAVKDFLQQCGVDISLDEYSNGDIFLELYDIDENIDKLTDEQLLQLLQFTDGGMYEYEEFIDSYAESVVYTNMGGYVRKDPMDYSDDFYTCYDVNDLAEIIDEYALLWSNDVLLDNETELTQADLACAEFWELVEEFADAIELTVNDDKTAGSLTIKSLDNYFCMQEFSDVLDNPFFLIHSVTETELANLTRGSKPLEKYKYRGRKS